MTDTIQNVAHFAPAGIREKLEDLGAEVVIEYRDVLSHGPSRYEPKKHRESRLSYWRSLYRQVLGDAESGDIDEAVAELENSYLSSEQLGSKMVQHADERRIVFWTTPTFEDRLFLWMGFHAFRETDVAVNRIATAEAQAPVPPEDDDFFALRDLEIEELVEGFDEIVYPEEIYVQAGAQLWQVFSSESPRKFAISIPHTEKFFPNIGIIAENYGSMFPVARGKDASGYELSEFDSELLGTLSPERWQTAFDVLGAEFVERFHFVDDLAIAARLASWADYAEEAPYVESRPVDDPPSIFEGREYRLAERGSELLEKGFSEDDSAPIIELGDCRIYAGAEPWVKVIDGEHWYFERQSVAR